jgi:tetratricopeptide (TPR) repeat protein
MWIKFIMVKRLFFLLALFTWNFSIAQQNKSVDFPKNNHILSNEKVININDDNITEEWLSECGKDVDKCEKLLIKKIQENPNDVNYPELLIQVYVYQNSLEKAWIQRRALDNRLKQQGQKITELGQHCIQKENWDLAVRIFDYLIKTYSTSNRISRWRQMSLFSKVKSYSEQEKNLDSALSVLNLALKEIDPNSSAQSEIRMEMATIYSYQNKKYDALLLLAQVEKLSKDSPIAYEAKLKKAKIYYYTGDFELAKELLDILKESSQKEIANDALNLRWVIEDNTGIDSLETSLKTFSAIQWMYDQKKIAEADQMLEQFSQNVKQSSLEDDVLFLKAKRLMEQNKKDLAKIVFQDIWLRFPNDIYGDDALYYYLKLIRYTDKKLVKEFIEKYPTSLFQAEIRAELEKP